MSPETRQKWMMLILGLVLGALVGRWGGGEDGSQVVNNEENKYFPSVSALGGAGGAERGENEKAEGAAEEARGGDIARWLAAIAGLGSGDYASRGEIWAEVNALGLERATAMFDELVAAPMGNAEYELLQIISESIARMDPERALSMAARSDRSGVGIWSLCGGAAEALVKDDPEHALEVVSGVKNAHQRMAAMHRMLNSLARSSPDTFEAWLRDPQRRAECMRGHPWAMRSAVEQWSVLDPARAARVVASLPAGELREGVFDDLANAYARRDMEGALAWAEGLTDLVQRKEVFEQIAQEMAHSDTAAALALADKQTDKSLSDQMKFEVIGIWAGKDPAAAYAWVQSQEGAVRERGLRQWVSSAIAAGTAPAEVVASLQSEPDIDLKAQLIGRAVRSWTQMDAPAAGAWVESIDDPQVLQAARVNLFRQSLHQRREWLAQHISEVRASDPSAFADNIGSLASGLAGHDPAGALEWVQSLDSDGEASVPAVVGEWARRDPSAAAAFVVAAEEGPRRTDMIASTAARWANSDPDAAAAWVGALEGADAIAASGSLITQFSNGGETERAAAMFESLLGSDEPVTGTQMENAARALIGDMSGDERPRALAMIADIDDPGVRAGAAGGLVQAWLRSDPAAASEWVGGLEPGRARDAGVGHIVGRSLSENDGEAAFAWSVTMVGEGRVPTMEKALKAWARQDVDLAEAALESAGVSEAERERLRNALR